MSVVAPERPVLSWDTVDIADDFDLDVRIAVNADLQTPEGGFSNWLSCKGGSCAGSCAGCGPRSITCTTGSRVC